MNNELKETIILCPDCKGLGTRMRTNFLAKKPCSCTYTGMRTAICKKCEGTGEVLTKKDYQENCPTCGSKGRLLKTEEIRYSILKS